MWELRNILENMIWMLARTRTTHDECAYASEAMCGPVAKPSGSRRDVQTLKMIRFVGCRVFFGCVYVLRSSSECIFGHCLNEKATHTHTRKKLHTTPLSVLPLSYKKSTQHYIVIQNLMWNVGLLLRLLLLRLVVWLSIYHSAAFGLFFVSPFRKSVYLFCLYLSRFLPCDVYTQRKKKRRSSIFIYTIGAKITSAKKSGRMKLYCEMYM